MNDTTMAAGAPDQRRWSFLLPVGFLFLLSGATGLLYEVLWSRQLVLVLGGSYPAVVAVVTAFLAGLAGGAALGGRWAHRVARPLKAYGILEAAIGIYCGLFPWILDLLHPVFGVLYRSLSGSPAIHSAVRFIIAALLLMPPTLAMGATLPFLVRYVVRVRDRMVGGIGLLYGLNTVGAAGGALLTGMWILPALGIKGTLLVGVIANLLVAAVAVLLDRAREAEAKRQVDGQGEGNVEATSTATATAETEAETSDDPVPEPALVRSLLFLAAGSGFAAMVDQLGWTKALILFLGSSTHAFTLIVSAFILGLGVGGLAAPLIRTRSSRLPLVLASLQIVIGTSAWYGLHLLIDLPVNFVEAMEAMRGDWGAVMGWEFRRVLGIVILPTFAMGLTFPVLVAALAGSADKASGSVGRVYTWNTVGTILGSLVGGMLLVPALGIRGALLVAVAINFGLGALVFATALPRRKGVAAALACLIAAGALSATAPEWPPHRLQSGTFAYWGSLLGKSRREGKPVDLVMRDELWDTLYYEEGRTATVSVVRSTDGSVFMRVNGKTDAGTGDMATQVNLGHVPSMAMPGAKSGLIIGLATGVSAAAAESYELERTDVIEISPEVLDASRIFAPLNWDFSKRPGVRVILEDGRTHIDHAEETYDVIVSEPTNPWIAGVSNLFTEEYFKACKRRVTEKGVVGIWLQSYQISADDFRLVCRTFQSVFPNATLWELVPYGDYMLVACRDESVDVVRTIAEREMPGERARATLLVGGIRTKEDLLSRLVCGQEGLRHFAGEGPLHTDDRLQLEFNTPHGVVRDDDYVIISMDDIDRGRGTSEALAVVTEEGRARLKAQQQARADAREGYALLAGLHDEKTNRNTILDISENESARTAALAELPPTVRARLEDWMANPLETPLADSDSVHVVMSRAIGYLQACLDASPEDRWTAETLANALERRARQLIEDENALGDAEADLLRAVRLLPWSAKIPYRLGVARLKASGGNPDSPYLPLALQTFELTLLRNESHEQALSQRAVCLSLLKREDEAEAAFRKGLEVRPDSVEILFNFATHLRAVGKTYEALIHANRAATIFPGMRGLEELLVQLGGAAPPK